MITIVLGYLFFICPVYVTSQFSFPVQLPLLLQKASFNLSFSFVSLNIYSNSRFPVLLYCQTIMSVYSTFFSVFQVLFVLVFDLFNTLMFCT